MHRFVKLVIGAVALAAVPQLASGADIQARRAAQPPVTAPVSVYNWTGLYLGVHAGYGWGDIESIDQNGWFGGGQIGYNWQAAGSPWVFGLEADVAGGSIDGSGSATAAGFDISGESKVRVFGTGRARVGFANGPWLPYLTGGVAWANNKVTISGGGADESDTQTHVGWTAGGGVEWAFAPQWTAKAEYLFMGLGEKKYFNTDEGELNIHTVKLGVNYRFAPY
jgi:outer membrane immunogenic protein